MKSSLSVLLLMGLLLQADLGPWVQHIPGTSALRTIFFRDAQLPAGVVPARRAPAETIPELTSAITAAPKQTALYELRAREAELNLDFEQAEASWKSYAELAADKLQGATALADYYHRRLQVQPELDILLAAARQAENADPLFERALTLARNQALPEPAFASVYRAWMERSPDKQSTYDAFADHLISAGQYNEAEALAADYAKRFPAEDVLPTRIRAAIAARRGSPAEALKIYDAALRPLSSPAYVARYFGLLERSRQLRAFVGTTREAIARQPVALEPAARLFYYHQQGGRLPEAHRALLEFAGRKNTANSPWTADEQITLAKLFEATQNYPEAARYYNNAWRDHASEDGLAGVIGVLFAAPEQELGIGGGDLTFYRDIATIDRYPGTLNGILSLLFNTTYPQNEFAEQERIAVPYFHRAKASELIGDLEKRFPNSTRRATLRARLIQSYATYGASDAVIRLGAEYLKSFPAASGRPEVALAMADAYARLNRTADEFRVYDELLKELGAAAKGVPVGTTSEGPVRSPMYAQVLDRYLSRLVANKQLSQALALYRTEIDRNPDDPGLYQRLAAFMEQNKITNGITDVYTRAMRRFQDRSWHHKLARWYLRRQQTAAFTKVSREFIGVFSGSELENYFTDVVATANLDAVLYRDLNRFALQRFPNDLVFVRNLLSAYNTDGTRDPVAHESLLRRYWYYDSSIRAEFFELLSRTGTLETELAALEASTSNTRAAIQFVADGRAWQSHFEEAVKPADTLAAMFPGDRELNGRSASLFRSFGQTADATRVTGRMSRSAPRERAILAHLGDILASKERFWDAKTHWNRIPETEPGNPETWIEAATVFWDWYQYDDALRVISEGRARLKNPNAFAYEAGAIYENQRDYRSAIAEYIKGTSTDDRHRSLRRLLTLASRPATRDLAESATRGRFEIRVAVLEEQNRRDDLHNLLREQVRTAASMDALQKIEQIAEKNGYADIREAALEKQIGVTPDPVERLRLQIALARLLEDRGDAGAAERVITAAYKSDPATLGVIRSAVDFYWRTERRDQAIDTLANAAGRSNAMYRRGFLLEAARKATDATQYARARQFLEPLLREQPAAADLITAMADTWARAGDDHALREFYAAKLQEVSSAEGQAQLRRSLIPVLSRMNDYQGALDQYIEIARRFPDDERLIHEASTFARRHNLEQRLRGFLQNAERQSPKDARWPVLLARALTYLEQPDAAIDAYTRASALRPDRTDLLSARADLEDRLLRFEQSAATYARLYELTYRDPVWMVKSAEAQARLGRKDAAVAALRKAFMEDRPAQPRDYIEAARRLSSWNMIAEAKEFADKAPPDEDPAFQQVIRVRLRQTDWRRPETIAGEAAATVDTYYTPEEKTAFAAALAKIPDANRRTQIARSAGLQDALARDLRTIVRQQPANAPDRIYSLVEVQQQRALYSNLAQEMEALWKLTPPPTPNRDSLLVRAADNWRYAGNKAEELRVLGRLVETGGSGEWLPRYLALLADTAPQQLTALAQAGSPDVRNAAATAALSSDSPDVALQAIRARGSDMPPVWTAAYTALTGYHFNDNRPDVLSAFDSALGPRTVGAQIEAKFDRNAQLAGDTWFYYAARYGEFLDSQELLPAAAESRPASAEPYLELAAWLHERGSHAQALEEYDRALQVDTRLPAARARKAEILAASGKNGEAVTQWRQAFELWNGMQRGRLPVSFHADLQRSIASIAKAGLLEQLRPVIDRVLRSYMRRSGTYRVRELLQTLYEASSGKGMQWILALSTDAPVRSEFLLNLARESWVPAAEREPLYREILKIAEADLASKTGEARNDAQWRLQNARLQWVESLIDAGELQEASAALPDRSDDMRVTTLRLQIAAMSNGLEPLWQRFREDPSDAPPAGTIQSVADTLRKRGATPSARQLLEGYYRFQSEQGIYDASTFLGLAEVLLAGGQTAPALAALRRMTVVVPEPFDTLRPASQLLQRFRQTNEAREFLERRTRAVPWDTAARTELAVLTNNATQLRSIAADTQAPYADRAAAAAKLNAVTGLGSRELDLLASGKPITSQIAEQPHFFHARLASAESASDRTARARLLRGALALKPENTDVRLRLFRALMDAGSFAAAAGVFEPRLQNSMGEWLRAEDPQMKPQTWVAESFLREYSDRARIATELARAYREADRFGAARNLLIVAQQIDPSAASDADISALEDALGRRAENRQRMPVITNGVEQPIVVRQRLTAQGAAR